MKWIFLFITVLCVSCSSSSNSNESKIESRTWFLIQQSIGDQKMASNNKCVFQNDSICIIDYTLTDNNIKHQKEYIYYNSYMGEMVSEIDLNKEESLISFAQSLKDQIKGMPTSENVKLEDLIIISTMKQILYKGKQVNQKDK